MKSKVLVVEDNVEIAKVIKLYLSGTGHDIYMADNGLQALEICKEINIDLGIFDLMIPGIDGYELIQEVRTFSDMPILILSAKTEDHDKILGFSIGADDYITKPFNPVELIARVNAALRRWDLLNKSKGTVGNIALGQLLLNLDSYTLKKENEEIILTATEYKIVKLLMSQPGRIFSKVQICEIIHGEFFESDENAIIVHISHIRDKIGNNKSGQSYIKTKRGLGYKIES